MTTEPDNKPGSGKTHQDLSGLLASIRTGMSFQRTRLSADRTLMAVIRTSLSLIGFGFTIFQFFQHLQQSELNFSVSIYMKIFTMAMVIMGIIMLILGIIYQIRFMTQIRKERTELLQKSLLPTIDKYPVSMTLVIALLLFLLGLTAILIMYLQINPDEFRIKI
jgi:putative membrane protein